VKATRFAPNFILVYIVLDSASAFSQESFSPYVDAEGAMQFPENFRTSIYF
jgi:hypothetical protein